MAPKTNGLNKTTYGTNFNKNAPENKKISQQAVSFTVIRRGGKACYKVNCEEVIACMAGIIQGLEDRITILEGA